MLEVLLVLLRFSLQTLLVHELFKTQSQNWKPLKMKIADILIAILVVTIWGFNFVVIKLGLQGLTPILFSGLRFTFAALPLVLFVKKPAIPAKLLIGYGVFQFALQFTLLFSGIKLGFAAGLASMVIQLQAFFTIGLAALLLKEVPKRMQLMGALIALLGMGLVAIHLEEKATLIGFVLVVAGGVCWAIANILTKKMGAVNPLGLVIWASLIASPLVLICSLLIEGPSAWTEAYAKLNWLSIGAVLFQSYPNTILGFGLWSMLIRKYNVASVAPFSLLVPISGMISASFILDEPLQWWKIVAGLLVIFGLGLSQFGSRIFSKGKVA